MKKNLLVTLADKNYVEQAKQLFSSVYFNAGWKGDYMLLSYDIPEGDLRWFKEKGILVKEANPEKFFKFKKDWVKIFSRKEKNISVTTDYSQIFNIWYTASCKFLLFAPYFKEWKNIIYLDADITVKSSLDKLTKVEGFAVCHDYDCRKLTHQLVKRMTRKMYLQKKSINVGRNKIDNKSLLKLKENYNIQSKAFNSGVMAFSTDIITDKTFSKIKNLFDSYGKISFGSVYEQGILNLLFYKKWAPLPIIYNVYPYYFSRFCNINPEKTKGIIFHFTADKPWPNKNKKDYFYREWKHNLERADLIDLKKPQESKKWTSWEIEKYSLYLKSKIFLYRFKSMVNPYPYINRQIGLFGIFLKKKSPKTYYILKK